MGIEVQIQVVWVLMLQTLVDDKIYRDVEERVVKPT